MAANNNPPRSSTRQLELALFEKIDQQLDGIVEDVRDVRERVIRIEAQDPSAKIVALEARVRTLEDWKSKIAGQVAMIVVPLAAAVGGLVEFIISLMK